VSQQASENPSRRTQFAADAALLLVALVWGSTFVMVKRAVAAYPVFPFLAIRFGIGGLALAVLCLAVRARVTWHTVKNGAILGLLLFGGYALQTVGLQWTSASKAGFITGLSVGASHVTEQHGYQHWRLGRARLRGLLCASRGRHQRLRARIPSHRVGDGPD